MNKRKLSILAFTYSVSASLVFVCVLALAAQVAAQTAPAAAPGKKAAAAQAAPVRPPRLVVTRHALPNGLAVLMLEDHSAPVVNLQMWYHVGSKDEREGRTGFAHLFEHLMLKGSAHVDPEEHSRIIEAVGGFDNAYTNFGARRLPTAQVRRVGTLTSDGCPQRRLPARCLSGRRAWVSSDLRLPCHSLAVSACH